MTEEKNLTFMDHLAELRIRLIYIVISLLVGVAVSWFFAKDLYYFLTLPLIRIQQFSKIMFKEPFEPFFVYLKVSLYAGFLLTLPLTLYQTWKFVAPGLYSTEKKAVFPFIFLSTLFFAAGTAFSYYLVLPFCYRMIAASFITASIQPAIMMNEYLSTTLKFLFAFGLVFELPIIIFFLGYLDIVNLENLKKFRGYNIVIGFIVGALITPGDILITQFMIAACFIALYEFGLFGVWLLSRRKKNEKNEECP